jgi:dsDNA-specific endonuclease/ATPase MutS2
MKVIKLNEKDLSNIVKKVLREQEEENYMFFSNLMQIRRQCDMLLKMDKTMLDEILQNGHDWADDHVTEAKVNMDQVFDFIMNEKNKHSEYDDTEEINEGRKKKNVATNKKLWQQSLAWARERYDVCPSAYCNGAAVKRYNSKGGKWKKE